HWWPSDSAILTREYDGRRACTNCGPCDLGGPTGAKASTDITYWPKARATGARRLTRARGRPLLRRRRTPLRAEGARGGLRRQRDRHAAAPAELALGPVPGRAGQSER